MLHSNNPFKFIVDKYVNTELDPRVHDKVFSETYSKKYELSKTNSRIKQL